MTHGRKDRKKEKEKIERLKKAKELSINTKTMLVQKKK